MKALLIDDEQANLDNLRILIETYCPEVNVCGTALGALDATTMLDTHKPDLVFLDIQMPGLNGFEWLRSLPASNFGLIFVTAFDQYAIQALRLAAIDYLLKPVAIDELQTAVARAHQQHLLKGQNQLLQNLVHMLGENTKPADQRLALATGKETRFVNTGEIVRCESANNYTTFHLSGGETLLVCKPIFLYDELLQTYGFVRCHQSHLVNQAFIKSWNREYGDFLFLSDGSEVPVSRGKKEELKRILRL